MFNVIFQLQLDHLFSDISIWTVHLVLLWKVHSKGLFKRFSNTAFLAVSRHLHNIAIEGQMPRDYGSLTKSLSSDRTRLVDFSAGLFSVPKIAEPPPLRNRKSFYSSGKFVFFVFSPCEERKSFTLKMAQAGLQRLLNMFLHLHPRDDPRVRSIRLGQKELGAQVVRIPAESSTRIRRSGKKSSLRKLASDALCRHERVRYEMQKS